MPLTCEHAGRSGALPNLLSIQQFRAAHEALQIACRACHSHPPSDCCILLAVQTAACACDVGSCCRRCVIRHAAT